MVKEIKDLSPATPVPADEFEFANPGGGANSSFRTTLDNLIKGSIVTGAGAPATTPSYVGERYFDTTGNREYIAIGTTSSADWKPLSYVDGDTYSGTHDFSGATVNLGDGNVTNADLADMAANTIKGRQGTTGTPQDLTDSQVRAIINVEDGATADQTAGEIEAIVSHDNLQGVNANQHIDWTASSAGSIDNTNVQDGADGSAIHDDTAGEINAITVKNTPVSADIILIEDSGDLFNKKKATVGSFASVDAANVGSGADVFRDKVGMTLNFRGINGVGAISAAVNADNVDLTLNDGAIDHDALNNYVANEHIDWTTDQGATNIDNANVQDGADATAIHRNLASEISTIAEKTTPTGTDILLIEDAAASNAKKRVQLANLPTAGGGEANTGSNVGGAEEVFRDKTGSVLNFRTLQGTATVQVSTSTDVIQFTAVAANINHDGLLNYVSQEHIRWDLPGAEQIDASRYTGGGGGEANLGANVGSGADIFRDKTGVTLNFRGINGTAGIGAVVSGDNVNLSGDHDALTNYVADEHVAHSGVTMTAGAGLTGGGTIAATRTFNVGAGTGITVNADDIAVNEGAVNHNALNNFSANQHVPSAAIAFFDGGGSDIANGSFVEVFCPVDGTVTVADLRSPQTGSITVTVRRATFANYPTFTTIDTVALSSAQKINDTGFTGSVSAGDTLRFETSGNTGIQELMASIGVDKT